MLISLNWLKDYINLDENIDIKELENALTMIGQEVENIELQGENLKNILTSKILELKMHPDSDHLTVCQVDNGSFVSQVVCGASNHKEGDIVAMAQVGAKLSEDFVIKNGDRIAQAVIAEVSRASFIVSLSLSSTERGNGGYGSTGV